MKKEKNEIKTKLNKAKDYILKVSISIRFIDIIPLILINIILWNVLFVGGFLINSMLFSACVYFLAGCMIFWFSKKTFGFFWEIFITALIQINFYKIFLVYRSHDYLLFFISLFVSILLIVLLNLGVIVARKIREKYNLKRRQDK